MSIGIDIPKVDVVLENVSMTLTKTDETTARGSALYYDSFYYDDGKYYNRWFSVEGELKTTDKPSVLKVVNDCAKINTGENIPIFEINV